MNLQRRRRPFVDPRFAEILTPALPRLFLGRFDEEALRHELEQAKILDGLEERGYPEISLRTEYVLEEPWGAPLRWEPGEMITPLSDPLRHYVESQYRAAVARGRESTRFRLR